MRGRVTRRTVGFSGGVEAAGAYPLPTRTDAHIDHHLPAERRRLPDQSAVQVDLRRGVQRRGRTEHGDRGRPRPTRDRGPRGRVARQRPHAVPEHLRAGEDRLGEAVIGEEAVVDRLVPDFIGPIDVTFRIQFHRHRRFVSRPRDRRLPDAHAVEEDEQRRQRTFRRVAIARRAQRPALVVIGAGVQRDPPAGRGDQFNRRFGLLRRDPGEGQPHPAEDAHLLAQFRRGGEQEGVIRLPGIDRFGGNRGNGLKFLQRPGARHSSDPHAHNRRDPPQPKPSFFSRHHPHHRLHFQSLARRRHVHPPQRRPPDGYQPRRRRSPTVYISPPAKHRQRIGHQTIYFPW